MRSNVARRMRVRLSAGGEGARPTSSTRARMNASIVVCGHDSLSTPGTGGSAIGWKDQNARSSAVILKPRFAARDVADDLGHGAPRSIHLIRMSISLALTIRIGYTLHLGPSNIVAQDMPRGMGWRNNGQMRELRHDDCLRRGQRG